MAELEKVIKCLELCRKFTSSCEGCPYENVPAVENCILTMHSDALGLLKKQEAVEPKTGHWIYKSDDELFMCSSCEMHSIRNDYPYCHWCGAKMKQEGR